MVLSMLAQIPALWIAVHGGRPLEFGAVALAIGSSAALPWRRLAPAPVLLIVAALCLPAIAFAAGPPLAAVPVAFAIAAAIFSGRKVWAWSTLAGLAVLGTVGLIAVTGAPWTAGRLLVVTLALCLIAALAEGARTRRDRYRAMSHEVAARRQSAAEAERLRIARELHDILAHSLSEISVQAGVGLHLFDSQPQQARDALAAIRETSGTALDEVRSVLGVLREGAEPVPRSPEPTLAGLPGLVDASARQGVTVALQNHLDEDAARQIPGPVQSAIYRITQEALTNVAKHGSARTARVLVRADASQYTLEIVDPAAPEPASSGKDAAESDGLAAPEAVSSRPATSGAESHVHRGLIGIRERAELLGGSAQAGPTADGGWCVSVSIPITNGAPR